MPVARSKGTGEEAVTQEEKEKPEESPLHVRVAEILGWVGISKDGFGAHAPWSGAATPGCMREWIPRYDLDWRESGRLIDRYDIEVGPTYSGMGSALPRWTAAVGCRDERDGEEFARGETPLIAVCNLLLALAKEGKLKP